MGPNGLAMLQGLLLFQPVDVAHLLLGIPGCFFLRPLLLFLLLALGLGLSAQPGSEQERVSKARESPQTGALATVVAERTVRPRVGVYCRCIPAIRNLCRRWAAWLCAGDIYCAGSMCAKNPASLNVPLPPSFPCRSVFLVRLSICLSSLMAL